MFRVEIERADGQIFFRGGGAPIEWREPDGAELEAELLWLRLSQTGHYASFRVLEQDGTVYSELEC